MKIYCFSNSNLLIKLNFFYSFFFHHIFSASGNVNLPPIFTQDMNNLALSETTPLNSVVYKLEGYDPEGASVTFGLIGSENFEVDANTGDVTLIKQLDREVSAHHNQDNIFWHLNLHFQKQDTLSFLVSIKDKVSESGDSDNDNFVQVPISIIILDENDNPPEFQNVSRSFYMGNTRGVENNYALCAMKRRRSCG